MILKTICQNLLSYLSKSINLSKSANIMPVIFFKFLLGFWPWLLLVIGCDLAVEAKAKKVFLLLSCHWPRYTQQQRLYQNSEFTTVSHQILMEIQQLVSDFFRTRTLTFVILKIEKHVNLEEENSKRERAEGVENLNSGALEITFPTCTNNPLNKTKATVYHSVPLPSQNKSTPPVCSGWKTVNII